MGTTITLKSVKTTPFTELVDKVVNFFKNLGKKTSNLSLIKETTLEDEVDRLHYLLTSSYSLENQNKILTLLINKTFDNRVDEKRALEASVASLKASISNNSNFISNS